MGPGDVIEDRFEIECHTATGGMGSVYRALDRMTGQRAAVKVVKAVDPEGIARFAREARTLSELRHPGIVAYLAHGHTAEGDLYLAMEWLEGQDLTERLSESELSLTETLDLAIRTAAALAAAHGRQVIHRDVKPSNLFLVGGQARLAKLLDFGVARVARLESVTASGALIGTPMYMAPEQARGSKSVDARTDVFAFGCVLFRCLTGRPPTPAASVPELLDFLLSDREAPRVRDLSPEVPGPIADLVASMLRKDQEGRPRDGGAVLSSLLALDLTMPGTTPSRAEISGRERLVSCRVLIGAKPDATMRALAVGHGAALKEHPSGAIAAFSMTRLPTDQAQMAARLAVALRRISPETPLAVVTVRSDAQTMDTPVSRAVGAWLQRRPGGDQPLPVRLDEATAGLLGAAFEVAGDTGGLVLVRERGETEAPRRLLGRNITLVGREREMSALEALYDDCVANEASRAVLVTGPPGIGKSRLTEEAIGRLRTRGDRAAFWIGQGDPIQAGAPLVMLGRAVRQAVGVRGGEPLAERRALLAAGVERVLPAARAGRVTEFLGELCGIPFDAEARPALRAARRDAALLGEQMRLAWEEWLAAECAVQPVVLVLEDLHWADLLTVKMVDGALRTCADRPFLVIALARPEVHELFPRIWENRGLQQINLAPIAPKAAARLVTQALGDLSPERVKEIVDTAQGSPFYLEELIRHVAAGGDIASLPDSILAMVEARFAALTADTRRVLRAASVFGSVFWAGGVGALLRETRGTVVDSAFAEIVDKEIARRRFQSRFPGELELEFSHILMREAAYAALPDEDRTVGHCLAGDYLERKGEPDAIVVADHFRRGNERARAASWYERAAQQALAANDAGAALQRAERGVDQGAQGQLLGRLRLLETVAFRMRSDNVSAKHASLQAMQNLSPGSDAWCIAAGEAVAAAGKMFERPELRELAGRLEEAAGQERISAQRAIALARAAGQCFLHGEPELGTPLIERIHPAPAHLADEAEVLAHAHAAIAYREYVSSSLHEAAMHAHDRAAELFDQVGDSRAACEQRIMAGFQRLLLGLFEQVRSELPRLGAEAEQLGMKGLACMASAFVVPALVALDDVEAAAAAAAHAEASLAVLGQPRIVVHVQRALGMVAEKQGRLSEAEACFRQAVGQGVAAYPAIVMALSHLALLRLKQGDAPEALELAQNAIGLLRDHVTSPFEPMARLAIAEAAVANGRADAQDLIVAAHHRLMTIADCIRDPATRDAYLRVPTNVRIRALAASD